jgi:predicted amino acid dehydrogenase
MNIIEALKAMHDRMARQAYLAEHPPVAYVSPAAYKRLADDGRIDAATGKILDAELARQCATAAITKA